MLYKQNYKFLLVVHLNFYSIKFFSSKFFRSEIFIIKNHWYFWTKLNFLVQNYAIFEMIKIKWPSQAFNIKESIYINNVILTWTICLTVYFIVLMDINGQWDGDFVGQNQVTKDSTSLFLLIFLFLYFTRSKGNLIST